MTLLRLTLAGAIAKAPECGMEVVSRPEPGTDR